MPGKVMACRAFFVVFYGSQRFFCSNPLALGSTILVFPKGTAPNRLSTLGEAEAVGSVRAFIITDPTKKSSHVLKNLG